MSDSDPAQTPTVDTTRLVNLLGLYNQIKAASSADELEFSSDADLFVKARWLYLRNNLRLIDQPKEDNV